nr:MAG TPA: hypothetical protein [Caudoviricetes sp.]
MVAIRHLNFCYKKRPHFETNLKCGPFFRYFISIIHEGLNRFQRDFSLSSRLPLQVLQFYLQLYLFHR